MSFVRNDVPRESRFADVRAKVWRCNVCDQETRQDSAEKGAKRPCEATPGCTGVEMCLLWTDKRAPSHRKRASSTRVQSAEARRLRGRPQIGLSIASDLLAWIDARVVSESARGRAEVIGEACEALRRFTLSEERAAMLVGVLRSPTATLSLDEREACASLISAAYLRDNLAK